MIEYGLIVALLSVALIGVITATGGGLKTTYTTLKNTLAAM
jgi:Flp pilus assembly pilin Flp